MVQYNWKDFLTDCSAELIALARNDPDFDEELDFPRSVLETNWLGFAGASKNHLAQLETRLGKELPPSYRQFLQISNGWRSYNGFPYYLLELWSTREIDWFATKEVGLAETWLKEGQIKNKEVADPLYFDYENQDEWLVRPEHLRAVLEIGGYDGNERCFLNPLAVTKEGEWEAWVYDPEQGFYRYPSFWEMLNSLWEWQETLQDEEEEEE